MSRAGITANGRDWLARYFMTCAISSASTRAIVVARSTSQRLDVYPARSSTQPRSATPRRINGTGLRNGLTMAKTAAIGCGGLATPGRPMSAIHVDEFFDGVLLLHRGLPDQAMRRLQPPPEDFRDWYSGMWRPWYAAVWAETAVAAGHEDAAARIHRARLLTLDNPIAAAMVERAAALQVPAGGRDRLTRAAAALDAAECRYQWARTLVLIGGEQRKRGEAALAAMGARPMAVSTAPAD